MDHIEPLHDPTTSQAIRTLQFQTRTLERWGGRAAQLFSATDLGRLHPVDTPAGQIVIGYELDRDLRPRDDLTEISELMTATGSSAWALAGWWTLPTPWLDGAVPLEELDRGRGDAVLEAARARRLSANPSR